MSLNCTHLKLGIFDKNQNGEHQAFIVKATAQNV